MTVKQSETPHVAPHVAVSILISLGVDQVMRRLRRHHQCVWRTKRIVLS